MAGAMTITCLLIYAGTLTLAAASPGPAIISIVTTAIARGWTPAAALALGVAIGDVPLAILVLLGLAFFAQSFGWVFFIIKYAGAAYLLWLGLKLWLSNNDAVDQSETSGVGRFAHFIMGVGISLGNPKQIFFHVGMMPLLVDLDHVSILDTFTIASIILCVDVGVCFSYAFAGARARSLFRPPRRVKLMNRAAGSAMIGTGILAASRA